MSFKKWVIGKPDREFAKLASDELDIDPFTALIASSRNINDLSELEIFLSSEPVLCDPYELADITKAADCINEAIESGLKIAIFGDYDCDGVMATAIMYKYLLSRNADVCTYIPERIAEGYGINKNAVDELAQKGVQLIITVDNGISCAEEIEYAATKGIITVVTDHHIPSEALPDACAVVDPHRIDCCSQFKEICGAQVAFYLICVTENKEPEEMLYDYADLLSVAIIGDFMPMVGENRSMARIGISLIKKNHNIGLSAVLSVAGIDKSLIDSSKISFGIVPRINAAGRMGSATRALDLVFETNMQSAISKANELESENALRQKLEKEILSKAVEIIENNGYMHNRIIVVNGDGFHLGIVGIVAARICEKYGRPAIVLGNDGLSAHGSGRSIAGFNIFEAIKACSQHLTRYGGHELAAGISIETDKISDFRKAVNLYALSINPPVPILNLDFKINPKALSIEMVDAIRELEPFGNHNQAPVFGIFDVTIQKITSIGQGKHLKIFLNKEGASFEGLLFNVTEHNFCFNTGDKIDIAVSLDKSNFRNVPTLTVIIKAIRLNGTDEDRLFSEIYAVDDYYAFGRVDYRLSSISREDIATVYKYILKNSVTAEGLIYNFINSIGYAKTYIISVILTELNLIKKENGYYFPYLTEKTELLNSHTYKKIATAGENIDRK